MNRSLGRVPKGALVSGETQHSDERRQVARACSAPTWGSTAWFWLFLLIACLISVCSCGAFCSMKIYWKVPPSPALREKHGKRFQQTMFGSQAHLWGSGTAQPLQGQLRKLPGSAQADAHLPFIYECLDRRQGEEGRGAKDREKDQGERGKERTGTGEDFLGPSLNTYWLNRTRERTMNLKMYSKALMALYSCSLIPGFSALAT